VAAEAAGSGAWSHGIGLVLIRSLPYTLACTAKSASGMAGGFIGRQPVTTNEGNAASSASVLLGGGVAAVGEQAERPETAPVIFSPG
jgi:hypothetical protein